MKHRNISTIYLLILCCIIYFPAVSQVKNFRGRTFSAAEMDAILEKKMDSLQMPGLSFAIINNGKIVYQRALGIANAESKTAVKNESIFEAASLSKPVFAYFVLKQVEKGLLALDTPLYKYYPYTDIEKDERYKLITARMVLTHQSGFPNWRWFERADSSLHVKQGDLYLKFLPGAQFAYSGEGFFYLSKVIAHLYKTDITKLDAIFQQQVAQPLQLKPFYFSGNNDIAKHKVIGHRNGKINKKKWPMSFPDQDSSWFGAAGGLHTNAQAYAGFLLAIMNEKGLTAKSFGEMLKPQVSLSKDSDGYKEDKDFAWGLGIALKETPYGTLYEHGGNNGDFQSRFVIDKKTKWGYVFFTNCEKGRALHVSLQQLLLGE